MTPAHDSPGMEYPVNQQWHAVVVRARRLRLVVTSIATGMLALVLLSPVYARASEALPLSFTPNAGQTDDRVRYVSQGAGYSFFFTDDKAVLAFAGDAPESKSLALDLRFVDANSGARPDVDDRAEGTVNRLTGSRGEWRPGIPAYEKLTYRDLWPGIDMVFHGRDGGLTYEFRVDPGADPRDIRLAYAGADGLSLDGDGSLAVHTALGELEHGAPVGYQPGDDGKRVRLESAYTIQDEGRGYGFEVGSSYDGSRPLVIEPGPAHSTFVGGTSSDSGRGIAVGDDGSVYVTGQTASANYPTTPGATDRGYNNNVDAFVTKLASSGSEIVYSTFIGGTAFDSGNALGVDQDGSAYVGGFTGSPNYPTMPGAFDRSHNGGSDAFVTKIDPSGSTLAYSTFLGGAGFSFEGANGIAVDGDGSAYATGFTGSAAYPTTPGAHDRTHNGRNDVYLTKLDPSGSTLAYSTFLGGSTSDTGNAVAVDGQGRAHVTGFSASADFPATTGAPDPTHNGGNDAFVAQFDPSGSALGYSTFLGGAGNDSGGAITVDEKGKAAHVTGSTDSADYPTSGLAQDASYNGNGDAFVARYSASGTELAYSTFLGGTGTDAGNGIAVDGKGRGSFVTGSTSSGDYPTTRHAYDGSYNGNGDAFLTRFRPSGFDLAYSTFLGGSAADSGLAIALDSKGKLVHVTGSTSSTDYPTTGDTVDSTHNGSDDAFVTTFDSRGHRHGYEGQGGGE